MSSAPNTGPEDANDDYTVPKWVKWSLIAVAALVVLGILAVLAFGADHGPGMHRSAPTLTIAMALLFGR